MDLVLFAGPVFLSRAFGAVRWERPTKVVAVNCEGSSTCQNLAYGMKAGSNGRILPQLVHEYAPGITVGRIALAAFSAGWGVLDTVLRHPEDRARIDAVVLSDAVYDGLGSKSGKPGYVAFGIEAAGGSKLMVSTTGNTTSGEHLGASDSMRLVWQDVQRATGAGEATVGVPAGVRPPSGGVHRLGADLYWLNYVKPDGSSDMEHVDQHALAPAIWQAYLAPWLGRSTRWPFLVLGAAGGAATTWLAWRAMRRARGSHRSPRL